jgi:hypothetical protein
MREGTDKYDDGSKGGYSYTEKLALVAQDMMAPTEIGLTSREEAIKEITGEEDPGIKLGDFITFEASVIPNELRAHWARQDLKVAPTGVTAQEWEAAWIEEHKNEFAIQGTVHSGTCHATVQRMYTDPILGFCDMMKNTATMLETKYEEIKKNDPNPIITRTDRKQAPNTSKTAPAPSSEQQEP